MLKRKFKFKRLCSHISTQRLKTQDGKIMPTHKIYIYIYLTTYLYVVFDGLYMLSKTFRLQQMSFILTNSRVHKWFCKT